jgi:hypothetical protein
MALYTNRLITQQEIIGTASYAEESLFANTASYVALTAGPGVIINSNDPLSISASVLTVNGVAPVNGNIAVALGGAVYTGTSASLAASSSGDITSSFSEGDTWIISQDPVPAQNGLSYVFDFETSGSWLPLASFDTAQGDARYLMLTPQQPLSGSLNLGGFSINNLSNPNLPTDAINLGYLTSSLLQFLTTQSFIDWSGSLFSYFNGTARLASSSLTASYVQIAETASYANNVPTSSWAITASHALNANTASFVNLARTASLAVTASRAISTLTADTASYVDTASWAVNAITSSYIKNAETASFVATASWANNVVSSSYAITASNALTSSLALRSLTASFVNPLTQSVSILGNLIVDGTASVTYLNTTYESSSIIYSSGSNTFGDDISDKQMFTGSVGMSGSLQVTGPATIPNITGSLFGTASHAISSSYVKVTGSGIIVRYNNDLIELTGSTGVTISDTPPTGLFADTGSLWFNSNDLGLYVRYQDTDGGQWVGISAVGPVSTASFAFQAGLADNALTASQATTVKGTVNVVPQTGSIYLPTSFTINTGATSDILQFTIPSAGVWDIGYVVYGETTGVGGYNNFFITDISNTVVANSSARSSYLAGTYGGNTTSMRIIITTTAATTYKLRGSSIVSSTIVGGTSTGLTTGVNWNKIGGTFTMI